MNKPSFVYVIYIASTADKVFQALTDGNLSERYWTGNRVESDWKVGSPFTLKLTRHDKNVVGKVVDLTRALSGTSCPVMGEWRKI